MLDKCSDHDKCFDEIDKKLTEILIRLEKGSGNFELLQHRIMLVERIAFGIMAFLCTGIGAAVVAVALKYGNGK